MDRRAYRAPSLPTLGSAGCENPPTDTVNRRQQAMSRLAIYSYITSGLWWPPGAKREPPSSLTPTLLASIPPHAHACSVSLCPLPLPLTLSGFSCLLLRLCLSPGPCLAQAHPYPSVEAQARPPQVLAPGCLCRHCDCSQTGPAVSPSLSLISGGPFWSLLYFIVLGGKFGEGGREKSLSSWSVLVPSETFTKVMFSCLWWAPHHPQALGAWTACCSFSALAKERPKA